MTSAAQLASERFPDTTLPSVLPLPSPPLTPEDCVRYLRQLHVILNMNQTRLAEIMRIVSYHRSTVSTDEDTGLGGEPTGGLDEMPAATGSGVEHAYVDRVTGRARLFVDTLDSLGDPYWFEVVQNAEDVPVDTTAFDGYLSAADDTVQEALDTLDDHTHVEADITDLDHFDVTAIHDDQKSEISAITEKAAPIGADMLLIEDSEDDNVKKMVQISSLPGGGLSQAQVLARGLGA